MTSDDRQSWLNDELRNVPLPSGMLAKLREIGVDIDAGLRAVAMPVDWKSRWQGVVQDEVLDQQLRAVPIPTELISNIFAAVEDDRLQDVPVPRGVVSRALAVTAATSPSRWQQRMQMVMAASLAMLIVGSYVLGMTGLTYLAYDVESQAPLVLTLSQSPLELTAMRPVHISALPDSELFPESIEAKPAPMSSLARFDRYFPMAPVDEVFALFRQSTSPTENIVILGQQILGQPLADQLKHPALSQVEMLKARGFRPPIELAYDRAFQFNQQTLPIVQLRQRKAASGSSNVQPLREVVIPLWTDNASFDQVERTLKAGKLPAPQDIHVEDFLAEVAGKLPGVAPGRVGIRTAGCPAPFASRAAKLLQVTAQAGAAQQTDNSPRHLTVAIHLSHDLDQGAALLQAQAALRRLVDHLREGDRLSLVTSLDSNVPLLQSAGLENKLAIYQAIRELSDQRPGDLSQILQAAAFTADQVNSDNRAAPTIVVLTNVVEQEIPLGALQLAHALKKQDVPLWMIPLGESNVHLKAFQEVGAEILSAHSSLELHSQLLQALRHRDQRVAEAVMLTIRFNPRAVAAYRLLGHGSTPDGGWTSAAIETTLRSEQASGGLFEVWLRPDGEDRVAEVKLQYREFATGRTQQRSQQIGRQSFVPTFAEAAPSLQLACIAGETAEVLRDSYFVESNRSLRWMLENSDLLNPQLQERPEFQRLQDVIRAAIANAHRNGGR
jgi:hypothetical protein